jgi:hypothetical protein
MGKEVFFQLKLLIKKDKDTSAIEEELSKDLECLLKVQGFASIGHESASRICSLVPHSNGDRRGNYF